MLAQNPAETVQGFSTFDGEEFALWTSVPRFTPKADRAEAFRVKAVDHTDEAEGLLTKAFEYNHKAGDQSLIVSTLLEGVAMRLAAATYCRDMAGAWSYLRSLENS